MKLPPHLKHNLDVLREDSPVQLISTKRPPNKESSRHPQHLPNDLHPHEVCREMQSSCAKMYYKPIFKTSVTQQALIHV